MEFIGNRKNGLLGGTERQARTRRLSRWMQTGASVSVIGLSSLALPALAQTEPDDAIPAAVAPAESDPIVVTGSRIIREGYDAPSPTTVVGTEQLDAAAPSNIADYLTTLPSLPGTATGRQGNNSISAGVTGMNRLDLRGIGTNRTLVLVDGRRFVGSTLGGDVDVNGIPNALVKRVEIVTGGASAVYGSDAVAGVVNFVLDSDFSGLKGDVQYGETRYGDGERYKASLSFGQKFADGRGHILLSGEYAKNKGVPNSFERPWFKRWDTLVNPNGPPNQITLPGVIDTRVAEGGLITAGPLAGTTFDPDGSPRAFDYGYFRSGILSAGGEGEGMYSIISLEGRLARKNLFGRASYEVDDGWEVFAEGSYSNSVSLTNSSRNYYRANQTIFRDNAYLSETVKTRMDELGITSFRYGFVLGIARPRVEVNTYRGVLGLNADLGNGWKWDSYYQYGQTDTESAIGTVTNNVKISQALDAVVGADGQVVCRSTLADPANGCVPINTFGGASVSDAAFDYVTGTPFLRQTIDQHVASTSVSGQPFNTWAGPVAIAAGAEYREESVSGESDPTGQRREWLFGNFQPTAGSISVKEVFGEALVPLAEGGPGLKALYFNGAVRLTDYDVSGTVVTWKAGLTYEPFDGLRLRGTQSRDIRAPNLSNLYQAGLTQRQNVDDPFRNNATTNFNRVSSGNLNLTPEKSDTTAIGIVFEPTFLPQFRGSVDYYNINIKDAITTLSNQQTVDRCFEGDAELCKFITRDSSGVITDIFVQPINIASLKVEGIDIDLAYRENLDALVPDSSMVLRVLASHVFKFQQDNSFVQEEFVGDNSGSVPNWRINATAIFNFGPASFNATARFISAGVLDNEWVEGVDIDNNRVPSMAYLDLGGAYKFADEQLEAYFRIDNVLNEQPPVVANALLGTNPTLYDTIGRVARVGLRFQF